MSDWLAACVWLLVNTVALVSTWSVSRRLFPDDELLDIIAHTILLWWAHIVLIATALGLLNALSGYTLACGITITALMSWGLSCRWVPLLPPLVVAPCLRDQCWLFIWGALLGVWGGHVLADGLGTLPTDWDTVSYHLPIINHWIQARSLFAPDCKEWATPCNNELIGLWMTSLFSGDFLAACNNVPSSVLLGLCARGAAATLKLPRAWANLAGLVIATNGIVWTQLTILDTDVATGACFLSSVWYMLRYVRCGSPNALCLVAVSLGLLGGVKYYAAGYVLLAVCTLVVAVTLTRGRRIAGYAFVINMVGIGVLSGYWYLRNVYITGSPFYPMGFNAEADMLGRIYPDVGSSSLFGNGDAEVLPLYASAVWSTGGPIQFIGFAFAPVCVVALSYCGVRRWRRQRADGVCRLLLAALTLGTGVLIGITPFAVEDQPGTLNQLRWQYCPVRYSTCFLCISILSFMVALYDMCGITWGRRGGRSPETAWARIGTRLPLALMSFAVAIQLYLLSVSRATNALDIWLVGLNLVLGATCLGLISTAWPRCRITIVTLTGLALFVTTSWLCRDLADGWHRNYAQRYHRLLGVPEYNFQLANNTRAVCVLDWRYYPYFGSRRHVRVCQPVYVLSELWMSKYLAQNDVAYVVVSTNEVDAGLKRFAEAKGYIGHNPDRFAPVYHDANVIVYKVRY